MKFGKLASLVLVSAVLAGSFAGCSGNNSVPAGSAASQAASEAVSQADAVGKSGGKKIGFAPTTMNNPYWVCIANTVKQQVEAKGDTFISVDPQNDQSKMNDQIGDLVAQGIDALLVAPVDSAGVKTALEQCKQKNIPVVNFDTPVKDKDMVSTIVASDNYNAGVVVAKDMMSKLPKGSKIAIMHSPVGQACIDRVNGFKKTVGDYFDIVSTLDGKGDTGVTLPLAEDVIQSTPDLKAFFAVNDPSAIGCSQALRAHNITGKVLVYGVDGNPTVKAKIKDGSITGTGAQSPKTMGKKSIEAAYDLIGGKTVEKTITVQTFLITKDNVDKYGVTDWQ
ncbi:MAG: sugar ABC transporter substrate-binding protein [Oscillospiraceae bacterium]|jgi:ribose transport system substrate-binding protein|nr:sugar ABC transporter substrate-binding protein [Oscillospiraceae bacterium]MCI1991520.1 sugar ABC transporter substrate-binding protein [Oscillospiraceae bacterium]MCI2034432.1 sugar ABC transporter substrate-binding protein [Oscillospiraceae bacterium]